MANVRISKFECTEEEFEVGMTVNAEICLFGFPGSSNRIEDSFIITQDGAHTLSPFVQNYCRNRVKKCQQ